MQLSHKYEVERLELKAKIKALRQKLSECGQCERDSETFYLSNPQVHENGQTDRTVAA